MFSICRIFPRTKPRPAGASLMKRIMLRVGALGIVVALGLIAIAQAQRGTETGDDIPLAVASDESADTGLGRPTPGAREAPPENPLRQGVPMAESEPFSVPRPFADAATPSRLTPAAPPSELPDAPHTDPFHRGSGGSGFASRQDNHAFGDDPALTVSHQEHSVPDAPDMQLADATRQPLRPLPSSASERYPELRPLEEDRTPGNGPLLGSALPAEPPDRGFADQPTGFSRVAGATGDGTPPAMFPAGLAGEAREARNPEPAGSRAEMSMDDGTGRPGGPHLEGAQAPQVTIEKIAPGAMQVGKPATFVTRVRNTGPVAATGLEVRDQVPHGAQLSATTPRASRGTRGELIWSLGTLDPGEEIAVEMQVTPTLEGEIGSVATVHFSAAASAKGIATKPELVLESSAPSEVLIGEGLKLSITLSNPGSGTATDVVLSERVPPGLRHAAGADLEYEVGVLKPGETRKLELDLVADRPGPVTNVIVARGDGNLRAEHRLDINVVAPQLDLAVDGPQRRFLEREAVYQVGVSNPGTAAARNVELVAHLPDGLEFISANNAGHYDSATRAVHWRLEELPVQETGVVKLVTMPVRPGDHSLRIRGTAAKGVEAESEQAVLIEGIAAILFEVRDVVDPVEVGGETVYEISVLNQGTKASSNVHVRVLLPPEMQPVAAEGPADHVIEGRQVAFEPLSRLAPKADTMYRVRARALEPGDLRVRVQVLTDEMRGAPVTKEESTRVYSDR